MNKEQDALLWHWCPQTVKHGKYSWQMYNTSKNLGILTQKE